MDLDPNKEYAIAAFTSLEEKSRTGDWWSPELKGEYVPAISLRSLSETGARQIPGPTRWPFRQGLSVLHASDRRPESRL